MVRSAHPGACLRQMVFDPSVDGQQPFGGAAAFGLVAGPAVAFLVELHVAMYLGADGGQDVVDDRVIGVEVSPSRDDGGCGQEILDLAAMARSDGRGDEVVVSVTEDEAAGAGSRTGERDDVRSAAWH